MCEHEDKAFTTTTLNEIDREAAKRATKGQTTPSSHEQYLRSVYQAEFEALRQKCRRGGGKKDNGVVICMDCDFCSANSDRAHKHST